MQTLFISLWMPPYVTTEVTKLTSGLIFSFVSLSLLIVYLFIYIPFRMRDWSCGTARLANAIAKEVLTWCGPAELTA